jgi:hypothetical protein
VPHHSPGSLPELVPSFVSGVQPMRFGPSKEIGGHRRRAVKGWSLNLHCVFVLLGLLTWDVVQFSSTQGIADIHEHR